MRHSAAVLLGVVAASAVVAIGATGVGLFLPPAALDDGSVRVVRIAGALAALVGLVALLVQRGRLRSDDRRDPDPAAAGLVAAAMTMGLLALVALLAPPVGVEDGVGGGSAIGTEGSKINPEATSPLPPPPPSQTAPVTEGFDDGGDVEEPDWQVSQREVGSGPVSDEDGLDWGNIFLLILLLAVVVAVVVTAILGLRGRLGRRRQEVPPDVPVAAADAEEGLRESFGEVAYEGGDPGQQITAAYHRLLAALTTAGAPRHPQEAPHEHLRRVLGPLGVDPEPMHRLTELYVAARFSEHPITERHRAAAAEALEVSLAGLRPARDRPGAKESSPAPEEVDA